MTDQRHLSEEEARALWRRAAELQAEAARRLEARSRSLADPEHEEAADGYRLSDVRSAAMEAGIGEEFVLQAMAEEEAGPVAGRGRSDALADWFLGEGSARRLVVSRVFDAPPEEVYGVLQRVLPAPPFELALADSRGGHPLEGGILVFDVPPLQLGQAAGFAYELRGWADVKEVHVSLRPVGEGRTEVTLRAPLAHARRVNLWVGGILVGLASTGIGAGVAGGAAALGAAAGLGSLLALLVVLAGLGAFGAGTVLGTVLWRALFGLARRRGEEALGKVLAAVGVHLRTGGAFGPTGGWPQLPSEGAADRGPAAEAPEEGDGPEG